MADTTRVFVGGVPYAATEEELKAHFMAAGNVVSVFMPIDRETGKKRGFAFVEFENEADMNKAVDMFNQTEFGGRTISVNSARPRE
ncbi:TPA: RNA-binding protein [Candidatus Uhrbacteria bacterium]|jgi:RNA recognition motif-containing protein|nr:RNA-binding protein [Candidatus Uhrbacteria bacterium]